MHLPSSAAHLSCSDSTQVLHQHQKQRRCHYTTTTAVSIALCQLLRSSATVACFSFGQRAQCDLLEYDD
ncbi:hypothetical protein BGZ60DRAFT_402079 [Tricladium varicosporioides]|nr:hypothetical protein BGZ60DRAFT_402079 [Hymenoscyphus varicosporioides]